MWPKKVENFRFSMLDNESKMFEKRRHDTITTVEDRIGSIKRFFLRDKESIINKWKKRDRDF